MGRGSCGESFAAAGPTAESTHRFTDAKNQPQIRLCNRFLCKTLPNHGFAQAVKSPTLQEQLLRSFTERLLKRDAFLWAGV